MLGGVGLCLAAGAPGQDPGQTSQPAVTNELERLVKLGEAADAEVVRWIRESRSANPNISPEAATELNRRIEARLESVNSEYKALVARHPKNDEVRVAYATFLSDIMREELAAQAQLETALSFTTNNPEVFNSLANIYGHLGSVRKAFDCYTRATELNPREPVYFHNFGTTVYLFRKDAMEHYGITEQQVFDKALELYARSMKLDSTNFALASDVALTYYGIKPPRTADALQAWTNVLNLAGTPVERESVALHLARLKIADRRLEEARAHLNTVTNQAHMDLKRRLERNLAAALAEPGALAPEPSPNPL